MNVDPTKKQEYTTVRRRTNRQHTGIRKGEHEVWNVINICRVCELCLRYFTSRSKCTKIAMLFTVLRHFNSGNSK